MFVMENWRQKKKTNSKKNIDMYCNDTSCSNLLNEIQELATQENFQNSLSIITEKKMNEMLASHLVIITDRIQMITKLANIEFYQAGGLFDWYHYRKTSTSSTFPKEAELRSYVYIPSTEIQHIDYSNDVLDVLRQNSPIFRRHSHLIAGNIQEFLRQIILIGEIDHNRSSKQFCIDISNGGLSMSDGIPTDIVGKRYIEKLKSEEKQLIFKSTLGRLVMFIWQVMKSIQEEANRPPLATNKSRLHQYSEKLMKYLELSPEGIPPVESLTLVVGILYPLYSDVDGHRDRLNDSMYSYSKTGALNMCFCDNQDRVYHLQILVNFRSVIRNYTLPFHKTVSVIKDDMKNYLQALQLSYDNFFQNQEVYVNRSTPFDRTGFFLDSRLPGEVFDLGKNVSMKIYTVLIGVSRVFSMSMYIDPIARLQQRLSYDQILELCFVTCLLNDPLRFNYTLNQLLQWDQDENHPFSFQKHPYYDW